MMSTPCNDVCCLHDGSVSLFDEDIEEHDYLDVCSTFHNDDDSCLLDVVDDLHNADDGVDKDVRITDSDVGLRNHDVHIGCLI